MNESEQHFSLEQLCVLLDLPRRTVRFYLQQGLVQRPVGTGRGAYYTEQHLQQLLAIKRWKEAGLSLERIRELLQGAPAELPPRPWRRGEVEVWSRIVLADGLELQVQPARAGISPEQLRRLAQAVNAAYEQLTAEEGS